VERDVVQGADRAVADGKVLDVQEHSGGNVTEREANHEISVLVIWVYAAAVPG
jgi:hypothetical protein